MTVNAPDPAATVQRYDCGGPVVPAVSGPFVRHSDYAALLAKLSAAEKERDLRVSQLDYCAAQFIAYGLDEAAPIEAHARTMVSLASERDSALTRTERAEKLLGEALPVVDQFAYENPTWGDGQTTQDPFGATALKEKIRAHLAASRGRG